jgi:hypothetical protein
MVFWWCINCDKIFIKRDSLKKHLKRKACFKIHKGTEAKQEREMAKSIVESMESFVSGLMSANLSEIEIADKLNASSYVTELRKNHNALW